jgi:ABC-type transporter Mla subunit MlaD
LARERIDVSLPPAGRLAVAGAGLLLVAMIVLLVAQLAVLSDSREHIVAQDRKINRIVKGTDPVLDQIEPVAGDARAVLRQAEPFVRDLRAELIPVLRDLRDVGTSGFFPRTLRAVEAVPRIPPILNATLAVQRSTLSTQLESLSTQRATFDLQRHALRLTRSSRQIQKRTLALFQRSLAVQEEALGHIRSIDNKTGGTAPAPAPAPLPGAAR